jgi:hypothetical protein
MLFLIYLLNIIIIVIIIISSTEDWTQGFAHARQAFYC